MTTKCNVPERWLHTDLGIKFVRSIAKAIKKAESTDIDELSKNENIRSLRERFRRFLTDSMLYDEYTVERTMRTEKEDEAVIKLTERLLIKERALLKMRMGKFKECFDLCINGPIRDLPYA